MDTAYLKKTIGDALMRGCSSTAIEAPADPVEYLGHWLHRYVKNAQIEEQLARDRRARQAIAEDIKTFEDEKKSEREKLEDRKAEALVRLSGMVEDPFLLWQEATKVAKMFTNINGAYVAALREDEEAEDEVPDESDDEEEGEEGAAEGEGEPEEEEAEEEPVPIDYSNKYLEYEAASSGHEWMIDTTLKRVVVVDEETGETQPPPPGSGVSFRIIDEDVPTIEVPNVLDDKDVKFYRTIPSPGTFFAASVKTMAGEIEAVLCVDTLMPSGSGSVLTEAERDYIVGIARAVAKAMDTAEDTRQKAVQLASEADEAVEMAAELEEMAEEAAEEAEEALTAVDLAEKDLATEKSKLQLIHEKITGFGDKQLKLLRAVPKTPRATYRVIKALLYVLGYKREEFCNWKLCRDLLTPQLFLDKLRSFNAEAERDPVAWKGVRSCMRGLNKKQLEKESPFGPHLVKLLDELKAVAKLAKKYREAVEVARIEAEEAARAEEEAARAAAEAEAAEAAAAEAEAEAAAA